jgi:hypothetical protein
MRNISRTWALILITVVAISCLGLVSVKPTNAQAIPKPSIPEFNLKLVEKSYDVPPIATIDPYSGKNVITQQGYSVKYHDIEVNIQNQPFVASQVNGNQISLYYNVSYKGHFSSNWNIEYGPEHGYFKPSNSDVTTVSLGNLTTDGEVDVMVQADMGYFYEVQVIPPLMDVHPYSFFGETSGWSSIQTISIPEGTVTLYPNRTNSPTYSSPTPTSLPSPTVPELSWLVIVPLLLSVFAVAVIVSHRRTAGLKR